MTSVQTVTKIAISLSEDRARAAPCAKGPSFMKGDHHLASHHLHGHDFYEFFNCINGSLCRFLVRTWLIAGALCSSAPACFPSSFMYQCPVMLLRVYEREVGVGVLGKIQMMRGVVILL